jgi:hypothetical protein
MNLKARKSQFLLFCLAVLAVCAITVQAQSGRRQAKQAPAAPVPTPTPEPTPTPTPPQKESDLAFILGADSLTAFNSFPLGYYDLVLQGCGDRLRSASSAHVTIAQDAMSRGEAIKKAKGETKTYVVNLKFVLDDMAQSLDHMELQFTVFAPQTGKVVTFFSGYLGTKGKGPIVVGPRGSNGSAMYLEQLLRRAGEDAADRILDKLNLNVPITH